MEIITIDAGIGTITANANGNLLLKQLLDAFKDKVEIADPQKVIDLLTTDSAESYESLKDRIAYLESEIGYKDKEIMDLEEQIDNNGLTEIDMGYGTIYYKTDNLKLEMYMESLAEKLQLQGV